MNYLTWRLHRNQAIFAGAALVALCVLLVITGAQMAHEYSSAVSSCAATRSCGDLSDELFHGDGFILDFVTAVSIVVPLLLGIFWGAPLIAKEIDEGTHRLAWGQSITRRQWLMVKVGWALAAALVWGASMTALVTWWHGPENALSDVSSPATSTSRASLPSRTAFLRYCLLSGECSAWMPERDHHWPS
jgi:hypothetical protein